MSKLTDIRFWSPSLPNSGYTEEDSGPSHKVIGSDFKLSNKSRKIQAQQRSLDAPMGPMLPQSALNPHHVPKGTLNNMFRPKPGYRHLAHTLRNLNNIYEFRARPYSQHHNRVAKLKFNPKAQFPPTHGYGTAADLKGGPSKGWPPGGIRVHDLGRATGGNITSPGSLNTSLEKALGQKWADGVRGAHWPAYRSVIIPKQGPPIPGERQSIQEIRRHEFKHASDNSPHHRTGGIKKRGQFNREFRANVTGRKSIRGGLGKTVDFAGSYPNMNKAHVVAGKVAKAALAPTIPKFIPKGANLGMMIGSTLPSTAIVPYEPGDNVGYGVKPDKIPGGTVHMTDPLSEPFPDNRRTLPEYPFETLKKNPNAGQTIFGPEI